jgi:hypothetical protein
MGIFGMLVAHEDDALRAVRAASELRDGGLAARIGVETGEALVAAGAVSGEVVRTASQLRDAAREGEIVVGEQTRVLVGESARLEPLWDERLGSWRLLEISGPGARTRPWSPLVGRSAELAELLAALELAVGSERAQLVTVLGEPGIGKSRLGQELADRVRGEADVIVGRCLAYGEAITYWPLRHAVREAGGVSYEAIRELLGDVASADAIARRVAGAIGLLDAVHTPSRRCAGPSVGCWRRWRADGRWSSASTTSTGPSRPSSISSSTSARPARRASSSSALPGPSCSSAALTGAGRVPTSGC